MNAKLESVLVITGREGNIMGLVRRDPKSGKQVIHITTEANSDDIASVITGSIDPAPVA